MRLFLRKITTQQQRVRIYEALLKLKSYLGKKPKAGKDRFKKDGFCNIDVIYDIRQLCRFHNGSAVGIYTCHVHD